MPHRSGADAGRRSRAFILLVAIVVLWGVNWPVMKVGLEDMPPLWFAAARLLLGSATLFLTAGRRVALPERADLPVFLSVTFFQLFLFLAFTHLALTVVAPGRSAILAYTTPLWVAPMAWLWLDERLDPPRAAALAAGLLGIAVLFNPLAFDWRSTELVVGNMLLLAAAFAWALAIVHMRGHPWRGTPFAMLPWQMLIAGIGLAAVAFVWETEPVDWTPRLALILAYNGPIASAFCFWAFVTVARALSATTTAMASLGVPIVGLATSAAWLGEPLTTDKLAGLALIAAAVGWLLHLEAAAPAGRRS
jgi:drug/metabolite transporter (DMT)-like permease